MSSTTKLIAATVAALTIIVGFILYVLLPEPSAPIDPAPIELTEEVIEDAPEAVVRELLIGSSVEGREIMATIFGSGEQQLLFVGGIHGGYEWNSSLLAYEMIDHFLENPEFVPEDVTITIIPNLNPDGTYLVTGKEGRFVAADIPDPSARVAEGRFNAHDVDLNRNFDCKWAPESTWRGEVVSAGTEAFSEPEARALRDFVTDNEPDVVVFWHSKANNVYASECEDGIIPETLEVMEKYATAASYGEVPAFDAYPITGDAEGWLASIGIPAVTVELETANSIEWSRNLAGVEALVNKYSVAK